ncbi:sirohydrochlorin chelatase [Heyndrickxia acidiproducens]|uniref:sirohydrochlorin chelatase n=1 Tax=Heyndrickxia acidiproducens TaxID=1121084 RepID=UPI0003720E1B|nr:sirohydrochlorin chelatase [Heyndrickxia acidiproducens]
MQGVLYICHGSRVPGALRESAGLIRSVRDKIDVPLQEVCFLEIAAPDIQQGIASLADKGATRIAIIPVLLLGAGHYYNDIPKTVRQVQQQYPHVHFTYGKPLGVQERLVDVLADRIHEIQAPVTRSTGIILAGRGSRSPQTKRDIEKIASMLEKRINAQSVEPCFLAACEPSFEEVLASALQKKFTHIFIVPYLWFTGFLMRDLKKKIAALHDPTIILCRHMGDHPSMKQALADRVNETLVEEVPLWHLSR